MLKSIFIVSAIGLFTQNAQAETRCGWINNPTPGNYWITDNAGDWIISSQGGYEATGAELTYPADYSENYVHTNGSYGYWCGCVSASTNTDDFKKIVEIFSSSALPLAQCLSDKNLPQDFRPHTLIHSSGKAYTECRAEEEQIGFHERQACVNKQGEYYFLAE